MGNYITGSFKPLWNNTTFWLSLCISLLYWPRALRNNGWLIKSHCLVSTKYFRWHRVLTFQSICPFSLFAHQGPVVQSIVSLTSLLRGQLVKCFTTLCPNTLIFFVEKMKEALSFSHFFNKKYWHISDIII